MPLLVSISLPGVRGPLYRSEHGDVVTATKPSTLVSGSHLPFFGVNAVLSLEGANPNRCRVGMCSRLQPVQRLDFLI